MMTRVAAVAAIICLFVFFPVTVTGTGESSTDGENTMATGSSLTAESITPLAAPMLPQGWIAGDTHTHSVYSGDSTGTIAQNFASGQLNGIGFINVSDHDNSTDTAWAEAIAAGEQTGIIPIRGNEYSGIRDAGSGHALFMNVDREFDYYWDGNYRHLISAIAQMKADTGGIGLAYASHPYDTTDGPDPWGTNSAWGADIDGIEVWNGWYASGYWANAQAFEKWDELNRDGRRLYGIAGTDAHSADGIGAVYTAAYTGGVFTAESIVDAFILGHMYGSNGPVIDFRVGAAMMGDTVSVPAGGTIVEVRMRGSFSENLGRVILIKNGGIEFSENISGSSFDVTISVEVVPGDFLRMELEGREGGGKSFTAGNYNTHSYFVSAPFAFSNPIFFDAKEEPDPPFAGLYGDVNGDGRVNGTDVQALILWINSGYSKGNIDEVAARVSFDWGRPDATDVQALIIWINKGGRADIGYPAPGWRP